jgi:hypothetical protein
MTRRTLSHGLSVLRSLLLAPFRNTQGLRAVDAPLVLAPPDAGGVKAPGLVRGAAVTAPRP